MVGRRSGNGECDYGSRRPLVPCSLFDCALHQLCSPGGRVWCGGTIYTSRAVNRSSLFLTDGHSTIGGICSDHCDLCWLRHISSLSWPQHSLLPHIRVGFLLILSGQCPLFCYRKALLTSVHYLVHLNLAIALFLGYTVFLAGTYYGPQDQVSILISYFHSALSLVSHVKIACALVAGALHYLFLSVFCWMLCEGIMLYLMLVIVFSTLSKKWWLFLLMGWGRGAPW